MNLFDIINQGNSIYPVIISLPHSGTFVPNDIRKSMLPGVLLPNSDWFLRELYAFLFDMGITAIASNVSRYVIDLNRDKIEDVSGEDYKTTLVYDQNTFGKPLYSHKLCPTEIQRRIEKYYAPYHAALEQLISDKLRYFDKVLLLDLHSFCVDFREGANEDISLSNYGNLTSTSGMIYALHDALAEQGYNVGVNVIRGRYILKNYKQIFQDKINCIQMELRYSQYIDNRSFEEEELESWDETLFAEAQVKLNTAFAKLFEEMEKS